MDFDIPESSDESGSEGEYVPPKLEDCLPAANSDDSESEKTLVVKAKPIPKVQPASAPKSSSGLPSASKLFKAPMKDTVGKMQFNSTSAIQEFDEIAEKQKLKEKLQKLPTTTDPDSDSDTPPTLPKVTLCTTPEERAAGLHPSSRGPPKKEKESKMFDDGINQWKVVGDKRKKDAETIKDKEKMKRQKGQSTHERWKSNEEFRLRQEFD